MGREKERRERKRGERGRKGREGQREREWREKGGEREGRRGRKEAGVGMRERRETIKNFPCACHHYLRSPLLQHCDMGAITAYNK